MARQDDLILEGVTPRDLASLRALAEGQVLPGRREIAPLHDKGWVDMVGEDVIITLTGRTLLDRQQARLR